MALTCIDSFCLLFCCGFSCAMTDVPTLVSNARRVVLFVGSVFCYLMQLLAILAPLILPVRSTILNMLNDSVVTIGSTQVATFIASTVVWFSTLFTTVFSSSSLLYWFLFPHISLWYIYYYCIHSVYVLVMQYLLPVSWISILVFYALYWSYVALAPYIGYSFVANAYSNIVDPSRVPMLIGNTIVAFYYNILIWLRNVLVIDLCNGYDSVHNYRPPAYGIKDYGTSISASSYQFDNTVATAKWYKSPKEVLFVVLAVLWASWFNIIPLVLSIPSLIIVCVLCSIAMMQKASRLVKE